MLVTFNTVDHSYFNTQAITNQQMPFYLVSTESISLLFLTFTVNLCTQKSKVVAEKGGIMAVELILHSCICQALDYSLEKLDMMKRKQITRNNEYDGSSRPYFYSTKGKCQVYRTLIHKHDCNNPITNPQMLDNQLHIVQKKPKISYSRLDVEPVTMSDEDDEIMMHETGKNIRSKWSSADNFHS